jgi:eukaryotic-like serine/threonine-protein kinase
MPDPVPDRIDLQRRALALTRAALERELEQREAFVDQICGDEAALRETVLSMLRLDRTAPHGFELLCEAGPELDDPLPGQVIGRFRLGPRLGSGGMGTVYRAEPVDGVTRLPVALKLIKRGMDSEQVVTRFLRERRILAGLDHPHIARLLDGGMSEDGRPWFAMELVEGEPISAWCDARRLDLAARVACFLPVCEAVAYAHRQLVVHRDLKPANVLVDVAGRVKLLDFGIAKLLDANTEGDARSVGLLLTPQYAAPEQFDRGDVGTQTDVYQLGLLLHELLCGLRASQPAGPDAAPEHLDAPLLRLARREPEAAEALARARGGSLHGLQRQLRGDLDRILRRALQPRAAHRYPSAEALAEDLRRWLRGEAVTATEPTLAYRARCFLRRHRVAASGAAAAVLALLVGLGVALREAAALRVAERETESALRLLEDVFLGADPYAAKGGDTRASDLLAQARARVEVERERHPALAARLLTQIGAAYVSLADRSAAEASLRAAVDAGERAGASATEATESARARLAHYALVDDGDRTALGDLELAIARLRTAGPEARLALAQALQFKRHHHFDTGDFGPIPALSGEILRLTEAAVGADSPDYVMALASRASLERVLGEYAQALSSAREAAKRLAKLGPAPPPAAALYVRQQLAGALVDSGRSAEAVPVLSEALEQAVALLGSDSPLAMGLAWEMAAAQRASGDFEGAATLLQALRDRMAPGPGANFAAVLHALGQSELALEQAEAAEAHLAEAAALVCAASDASPPCITVRLGWIEALIALDRPSQAREALQRLGTHLPAQASALQQRWQRLQAEAALTAGDAVQARDLLQPLLQAGQDSEARASLESAMVMVCWGASAERLGDLQAARDAYAGAERQLAALWSAEAAPLRRLRERRRRLEES